MKGLENGFPSKDLLIAANKPKKGLFVEQQDVAGTWVAKEHELATILDLRLHQTSNSYRSFNGLAAQRRSSFTNEMRVAKVKGITTRHDAADFDKVVDHI